MTEYVPGRNTDNLPEAYKIIHEPSAKYGVDIRSPSTARGLEEYATYQRRKREVGNDVLKGEGYPDILGFSTSQELLEYLKGKTVLDLGSGFNQFRRDIIEKHPDFPINIISVEPRLAIPAFREISNPDHVADKTTNSVKGGSVAANWENLPFTDNSFDRVLSVFAFPYWVKNGEWGQIQKGCDEIIRITKSGGEIRLAPFTYGNLFTRYLEKKGCNYSIIDTKATVDVPLCIVIKKP